ncbi:hypothetical protein CAEBREN_00440 [Caenorhabditis brenneri]|uniref:F-box domain-containing protein n=1 Tax=Caenorhabditis brenneri TaxID=135651 RepID=G0NKF1_CAEBE|nr:hypothetical protein CAEBREN_00440 [Caenorhabditis brenneri]
MEIMEIPIYLLPYFAWRKLVRMMPTPEAFSLSLASRKAARLVKISLLSSKPMLMDVEFVGADSYVKLYEENNPDPVIIWKILQLNQRVIKKGMKQCEVRGNQVMSWNKSSGQLEPIFYASSPSRSMEEKLFNFILAHMIDIFPKVTVNKLGITCCCHSKYSLSNMISTIQSAVHVSIDKYDFRNYTKYVLENIKITGSFECSSPTYNGGLLVDKLACTDKVSADNGTWMRSETLLSLNCSMMYFGKTKFGKKALIDFIRSWITSDGDEKKNIQKWTFDCPLGVIPISLEEFSGANWDPAVRPQFWKDVDCSTGIDIRRADGLLATVNQSFANRFEFVVWHDL